VHKGLAESAKSTLRASEVLYRRVGIGQISKSHQLFNFRGTDEVISDSPPTECVLYVTLHLLYPTSMSG
jgi:hypothetical protein